MDLIGLTTEFVRSQLKGIESGHDWFHIERVWKLSKNIREQENQGDLLTIELAALLHDIADPKFHDGDDEIGSQIAFNFLTKNGVDPRRIEHIQTIIKYVSFKGGFSQDIINSIEFQIVQDADRIDAIGAIGIARAFNYGGYKNRSIHDPELDLREYHDSKAYHRSDAPTINHFYEKLLKLKDLMNTQTGKKIAAERHKYMEHFLEQFYLEWEGKV